MGRLGPGRPSASSRRRHHPTAALRAGDTVAVTRVPEGSRMTAETLPPPLSILDGLDAASTAARVRVEGDRVLVDRLLIQDPALAAFVAERPADDRPELVGRALRIGLLAIQDTAVTLNVDVVRAEFEKLMRQA